MELRTTATLQSSLPPRFPTLKPAPDVASPPFALFISNSLRPSRFPLSYKVDQPYQQHSFPITDGARDTRPLMDCIGDGLSSTSTSASACSLDDSNGSDEKKSQMIRDCDKLIETFVVDDPSLTDWRRLLVFNKNWSNIRLHFFRHCQDRADSEDNVLMKNKLLWLGNNLKQIDEDMQRYNELIEMIQRTPSQIGDVVSRTRKDFTKEFFLHLHTVAESNDDNQKAQNGTTPLRCTQAINQASSLHTQQLASTIRRLSDQPESLPDQCQN